MTDPTPGMSRRYGLIRFSGQRLGALRIGAIATWSCSEAKDRLYGKVRPTKATTVQGVLARISLTD